MKKTVPYERLEKITSKLDKAIELQDREKFTKWYLIAKKECEVNYFSNFLINHVKFYASKPNNDFFSFLVNEVKKEFNNKTLGELIVKIMEAKEEKNYQVLQGIYGNNFYNDEFFTVKKTPSLIASYYVNAFSYDFDKILSFQSESFVSSYCKNLHMSELKDKSMTNLLLNKLSLPEKINIIFHNLEKSIKGNSLENIEYFYIKFLNESEINKDLRDDLLIASLLPNIRKEKDVLYLSAQAKKEIEEYKVELKKIVNNELKDEMLSSGGIFFKSLLDKVELKERLEVMQVKNIQSKRNKI